MNELIEDLWNKYRSEPWCDSNDDRMSDLTDYSNFKQAIQSACKAQRNACLRQFNERYPSRRSGNTIRSIINSSEIERCDYE